MQIFWVLASLSITYWLISNSQGRYPPPPPPWSSWLISLVVGTTGGLVGAWMLSRAMGVPTPQPAHTALDLLAPFAGAFIGVTLALGAYNLTTSAGRARTGPQ